MAEDFNNLPMYTQRELARIWIAQEMDAWQWEEDCKTYLHIRRAPTTSQYYQFLREAQMRDIFELAGY